MYEPPFGSRDHYHVTSLKDAVVTEFVDNFTLADAGTATVKD